MEIQPYRPRRLEPLGLIEPAEGWRLKHYVLSESGERPDGTLLTLSESLARRAILERATADEESYGLGFVCLHEASLFNQVIVDWWARSNELRHVVYRAWGDTPRDFEDITSSGEAFCVWELGLLAFERDGWIRSVLANPEGPDAEAYLALRLAGEV